MDKGYEEIQMANKYMQSYTTLLRYLNLKHKMVRFHFGSAHGQDFNVEYIYNVIFDAVEVKFREKSHINTVRWKCKLIQLLMRTIYRHLKNVYPFLPNKVFLQVN